MNKGFISHVDEVLAALEENRVRGFEVVGNKCADYAAMLSPVDTGRLKNSITWATTKSEGRPYTYRDDGGKQYDDHVGTGVPTDGVAVGSNVEYAA